jgi:hypothetical protein
MGNKNVQHDISQITMNRRYIWTLDVDCSPEGKWSGRFCGRRQKTSKTKITPFMKDLVLKISHPQANTNS